MTAATAAENGTTTEYDETRILPAYARTGARHSGYQPFEAQTRCMRFLSFLEYWLDAEHARFHQLLCDQGTPAENSTLTNDQAEFVARLARRFDREGERGAADAAELALNASGILLDVIRPRTVAESLQADREGRRMAEMRMFFLMQDDPDYLPF